jgi:hypothetical protein
LLQLLEQLALLRGQRLGHLDAQLDQVIALLAARRVDALGKRSRCPERAGAGTFTVAVPRTVRASTASGPGACHVADQAAEADQDAALLTATAEVVRKLRLLHQDALAERFEALRSKGDCDAIRLEVREIRSCLSANAGGRELSPAQPQ